PATGALAMMQRATRETARATLARLLRPAARPRRQLRPRPERLRDGPGLGGTASRGEGRVAVENFAEAAHAIDADVLSERLEQGQRGRPGAVDFEVSERERTEEPPPCRAWMMGAVAPARPAVIARLVVGMARIEAAEPERGQQVARADLHDASLPLRRQGACRQGN